MLGVDEVNGMDETTFVTTFGEILERSPHLAALAFRAQPFADTDALAAAFGEAVTSLDHEQALTLLRAHPVLGATGPMATASVGEQAGAGLSTLTDDRATRLATANAVYLDRFGFPFILAVSGLTADDVDAELERRSANDPDTELATALDEVRKIAAIRIGKLVAP